MHTLLAQPPLIRAAHARDAAVLVGIYNQYIRDSVATFETDAIAAEEMVHRMEEVTTARLPWLVIETDGQVAGYAYATKWKGRYGYRFSVEASIYLAPAVTRRGLGSQLYGALIACLREQGLHVVIGGVTLPNPASVALHEKFGFRKVAHFSAVGSKFDRWLDVGYWQREL